MKSGRKREKRSQYVPRDGASIGSKVKKTMQIHVGMVAQS